MKLSRTTHPSHHHQVFGPSTAACGLLLAGCLLAGLRTAAAQSLPEREQKLIGILESQAAPADKARACKGLLACGTDKAVPALAPLLLDPDLASWARIALEAIPGPAAEDALTAALPKLQGRLLVGTINSLGVRRDPAPVAALAAKLGDADAEVASAAAVALGCIGGDPAAQALEQSLASAPEAIRAAVAEGCIRCAGNFLKDRKDSEAAKLYDDVRQANVPKRRMLEATRGAILARRSAGIPLLLEQLRSPDKARFNLGLSTARELAGPEATRALAKELWVTPPGRQGYLLMALADRGETVAMPTVLDALRRGSKPLRLVAIDILDRYGNPAPAVHLLLAAAGNDPDITAAALAALARMPGEGVDKMVLERLPRSRGALRQAIIDLAARRLLKGALPEIARSAADPDPAVRSAAVRALGVLGEDAAVADLVQLLDKPQGQQDRAEVEAALLAIGTRQGAACAPQLLPLTRNGDAAVRIVALHALASAGGPQAVEAVQAALQDADQTVQDEAVRTLSTWPNTWPEDERVAEPLLALARAPGNPTHQVLALRGYLQFLQGDKKLNGDEKTARLKESLTLMTRPEEKRQAIAVIRGIPNTQALDVLTGFAQDTAVAEEAFAALVDTASRNTPGLDKAEREKALNAALTQSKNEITRKKAEKALTGLK